MSQENKPETKFKVFDQFAQENGLKEPEPPIDPEQAYISVIAQKYGPPAYENEKRQLSRINERFWAALYKQENVVLYDPTPGLFYLFNSKNGLYESRSQAAICDGVAERIYAASLSWGPSWVALQRFRTITTLRAIVAQLRGMVEKRDPFTNRPNIIHCANFVLKLGEDGVYIPGLFSKLYLSRHASPIAYRPEALCPKFEDRLLGHLPEHSRETLQKAFGLALIGRNLIQKIFNLEGASSASKGALLEVLRHLVGLSNCDELRVHLLGERFEIAAISTKSLLFGADVPSNFLSLPGVHRLKALVGGDLLACETKGSTERVTVKGQFNVMLTSNVRLRIKLDPNRAESSGLDSERESWRRRLVIVTYEQGYKGQSEPDIVGRLLKEEASGILSWGIRGAEMLMADIRQSGSIVLSAEEERRVDNLLDESESVRTFLKKNVSRAEGALATSVLVNAYSQYCHERDWRPLSERLVEESLPDLMDELFGSKRTNNARDPVSKTSVRGYRGVTLLTSQK